MLFALLIARLSAFLLRLLGRGATTLPGRLALRLCPNIISRLSKGVFVTCVTGTNGKTTTCALLEHALRKAGEACLINKGGANMLSGVAAAFVMNSSLTGKPLKKYAVLECDENSLPKITRAVHADIIAVTNIFRDQLDRYGEISHTLSKIEQGIKNSPDALLILNADCPLTSSLALKVGNRCEFFSLCGNFAQDGAAGDGLYCPVCEARLEYASRTYAQLGDFFCPRCGYRRAAPSCFAADVNLSCESESSFVITDRYGAHLCSTSLGGIYNVYNFCTADAVLCAAGFNASAGLCGFKGAFGRMERFNCGGKSVLLLLVKNPVGLSGCIKYVSALRESPDFAFVLNDNEADGRDVSWVWDSDFSPLCNKSSHVYTAGTRSADMALRLKYDGIATDGFIGGEDYRALIKIIKNSKRDFAVFSTYTAMMTMRPLFINAFGGKDFWE